LTLETRILKLYAHEASRVLNLAYMRRALIFGLALSLVGLVPVPVSACALFSARPAECATPQTESQCDQMNADASGPQLAAAPSTSCCVVSRAPLPESQTKPTEFSLSPTHAVLPDRTWDLPGSDNEGLPDVARDVSPPSLQPLLCTFLI